MNKILISLVILSLFIIGTLFFILNKDKLSKFNPAPKTTPQASSSTQTFKGTITQIILLDNARLQIELDAQTPQILVAKDFGIAKFSSQTPGKIELTTADRLKVGDSVEVKMNYEPKTQTYSLYSIYLK